MSDDALRLKPQPGPQSRFVGATEDIVIYGGAAFGGKSYALLMSPLRWVRNPNFGAVLFRRTYPEIEAEGGLWDESAKLYPLMQGQKRGGMTWAFPSGASISFSHMAEEDDRFRWKSSQIPFIGFDQLETFTASQFWYMLSRNRSSCGAPLFVRATVNPDPDSFVAELVRWYIDQDTGYAIPERSGRRRYFARDRDEIVWADSPLQLMERMGPECEPKSFTFIRATVEDNPIGVRQNPKYVSNLKALGLIDHEQLRLGNWRIRASAGTMFRREWFEVVDSVPDGTLEEVRYWDLGGSEDGDPSAGVRIGRCKLSGLYYVRDVKLARDVPHKVEQAIKNTASQDGRRVMVGLSCDPGQAGVWQIEHLITALDGYNLATHREKGDKVERAKPFSSQCGHGRVKLLRGEWNEPFLRELENFPSKGWHDDQVDAASNGHFLLAHQFNVSDYENQQPEASPQWDAWVSRQDRSVYA